MEQLIGLSTAGDHVNAEHINNFRQDAIRVIGHDTAIRNCVVTDLLSYVPKSVIDNPNPINKLFYQQALALREDAHRDGVQIIPPSMVEGCHNQQYAASMVENVLIENCSFEAPWSHLQPIFMGDGLGKNIIIHNNRMNSGSEHQISLYGLIDGSIKGNTSNGEPAKVRLRPCRIGGGMKGFPRVWIRSFLDEQYDYVDGHLIYHDDPAYLLDQRRSTDLPGNNIYLDNFDWEGFRAAVVNHMQCYPIHGAQAACVEFLKLAQGYGVVK